MPTRGVLNRQGDHALRPASLARPWVLGSQDGEGNRSPPWDAVHQLKAPCAREVQPPQRGSGCNSWGSPPPALPGLPTQPSGSNHRPPDPPLDYPAAVAGLRDPLPMRASKAGGC